MKGLRHYMTGGDWLVVLTLLALSLAGLAWLAGAPQGARVIVTSGDRVLFTGSLDQPQSVDLDGPLGPTHLTIDRQGARITASPCPRKICIGMGPARHSGDLLACVPNRILVRIESAADAEVPYDMLSR